MNGVWLHNKEIDLSKWDQLVNSDDQATIFSTSHYLNATCSDWFAYTNEDYSFGFAVGTTEHLGVTNIYPPFFHRYSEFIGAVKNIDKSHLISSMIEKFKGGTLHTKQQLKSFKTERSYVHQILNKSNYKLKSQAKRMIKKFDTTKYTLSFDNSQSEQLLKLVKDELSKKMDLYSSSSSKGLDRLITDLPNEIKLKTLVLESKNHLEGGLLALEYKQTVLFLKGTATESAKESGGMYALMNELIRYTIDQNKTFDFGGSRVEGVRFFNSRFNTEDKVYFCYQWNNNPSWYKFIKRIHQWKRK